MRGPDPNMSERNKTHGVFLCSAGNRLSSPLSADSYEGPKGERRSWFLSLHKLSLSSVYKSSAPPSKLQPSYKDLLYRLPGLSLKSFVN